MSLPRHRSETALAWLSLAVLVPYAGAETWGAWPDLAGPGYFIDALACALLLFGAVQSLRCRPFPAPGPLCGAWGFTACLHLRSYFTRVISERRGLGTYDHEPGFVQPLLATLLPGTLLIFAWSLFLASRRPDSTSSS